MVQVDMMKALQLDVTVIECPWGEGASEEKLAEVLKVRTSSAQLQLTHSH